MRELTLFATGRYDRTVRGELISTTPGSNGNSARLPKCPTCDAPTRWAGNPQRPFCSLTCRLIDLGVWLDEHYRIESPAAPDVP